MHRNQADTEMERDMTALTRLRALVDALNSPQSKRHDTQSAVLYEARREAAGILADLDWRDISTAPKDGTPMLFCHYDDPEQDVLPIMSGFWSRLSEGWFAELTGHKINPTHWLPLPEPPALAVKTDGDRNE